MAGILEKDQVGKREMLADYITITDAKSKPILAMIPKGKKLVNTYVRWQVDDYETPSITAQVDGQDATDFEDAARNRVELAVYCHYLRNSAKVSKLAEDVANVAGVSEGEMARSIRKKLEEMGRNVEAVLGADNESQADTGAVGYETRGLGTWITASTTTWSPVNSATYHPPSASIDATAMSSVTEAVIKAVLASVYAERGQTQTLDLICGPTLKRTISGLTQTSGGTDNTATTAVKTYTTPAADKTIISNVETYVGDFSTVNIHPSLLLDADGSDGNYRGYLLDFPMLELCWNQMPTVTKLPDLGGGPRAIIEAIFALVVKNPLGLGKFAATS